MLRFCLGFHHVFQKFNYFLLKTIFLYILNRFHVLILKIIFEKIYIILMHFSMKNILSMFI